MTLESVEKEDNVFEKRPDEKEAKISKRTLLIIQIAGGAIFGALSIIIEPLISPLVDLTKIYGYTLIDPTSIIWMTCFYLFGPLSGILCAFIGMMGMMPTDPFTPVGPIMKFIPTICLMLAPIIILKLYKPENGSQKLKTPKNFLICAIAGVLLREAVAVPLNIPAYLVLGFPPEGLGLHLINIAIGNPITSIMDLLIPYIIVFGAMDYGFKFDEKFEIW